MVRATLEIPRPIPNVLALDVSGDLSTMPVQRLSMLGCELVRKKKNSYWHRVYGKALVVIVVVIFY